MSESIGFDWFWANCKQNQFIGEPFLAYVNRKYTRNFGDWILGLPTKNYDNRYGWKGLYGNAINNMLSSSREHSKIISDKNDSYLLSLKKLKDKMEEKENQLYKEFNCSTIEQFKKIWYGKNSNQTIKDQWINKILNLFTGETQRLIVSSGFTPIEREMALVAIELDKMNIQGVEKFKRSIKSWLTEENVLREIKPGTAHNPHDFSVFVPWGTESQGFEDLMEVLKENAVEDSELEIKTVGGEILDLVVNKEKRYSRNTHKSKGKLVQNKTIGSAFVSWKIKPSAKTGQITKKQLTNKIQEFISKAIAATFNKEEWTAWQQYDGQKEVISDIKKMLNSFFSNEVNLNKYSGLNEKGKETLNKSDVMGMLGEIYVYGKNYFNLKNKFQDKDINILNLANVLNKKQKLMGTDILITINNTPYGFQAKNPFQTDKGYYETYKQNWNLGTKKSIDELYTNYLNFDKEQQQLFEFINVNLNNTTNPIKLENNIKQIFYYYSDIFMRLEGQEINKKVLQPNMQKQLAEINKVENTFFVLKGELIPSSTIIQGLIDQYTYFSEEVLTNEKIKDEVFKIIYRNQIPKNEAPDEAGKKYNADYIKTGSAYQQELSNITISTKLRLKIPSIREIQYLKG